MRQRPWQATIGTFCWCAPVGAPVMINGSLSQRYIKDTNLVHCISPSGPTGQLQGVICCASGELGHCRVLTLQGPHFDC